MNDARTRLIRRIHAQARSRGLDEAGRRALQERLTGKASCADMTLTELQRVATDLGSTRDRLPDGPASAKLRALWISGWHLGVVRDRSDAALIAFLKRATGLDAARFLHEPRDVGRAVEGIKAFLAREAEVDWRPHVSFDEKGRIKEHDHPRARVLEAQWRILHRLSVVFIGSTHALDAYACQHAKLGRADTRHALDHKQQDALIRHLGGKIRAAQGRTGARKAGQSP